MSIKTILNTYCVQSVNQMSDNELIEAMEYSNEFELVKELRKRKQESAQNMKTQLENLKRPHYKGFNK